MNHSTLCAAMIGSTVLVVCIVASTSRGVFDAADALKTRLRYGQYDALFIARCEARCWTAPNKNPCIKTCLLKGFDKPGRCPKSDTSLSPFDAVCQETCQQDSQCPSITKCCPNSCKGVTCQQPEGLAALVEVPGIPRDVKVTEGNKKKTISVKWKAQLPLPEGKEATIIYVIEERHHAGRNFIEERLSQWSYCGRSVKTSHILRNLVKPGRWYQFRVAAVNENGTKGFSQNSPTFGVSASPKPPKAPQNVTTGPLWTSNGTLYAELRWSPPPSDLPIQKYKVFWSRRLHGATALDSVLVHQQVVPKEQTQFLLQDLQPNSLYFLQVQAVAQFGKNRLKGEKSGLVLNTTNYTNVTDSISSVNISTKSRVDDLRLQKLDWSQGHLRARITWKPKKGPVRYTVSRWSGPCFKSVKPYSNLKFAATTKASRFDLHDLQFNCRYRVGVREVSLEGMKTMQDTSITFITPTCEKFRTKSKEVQCER